MFSAGTHHKRVPKDRKGNLAWRKHVLQRADQEPEYREYLIRACREDILFYINTFVWQHNPKKKGTEVGPFISWAFQDETLTSRDRNKPGILWCIENGEDAVIEKSRDMGASWLCLIAFEWLWHFHSDKNFIVISRNEDAVDKPGTPSCLFWKIDHIHTMLPKWLMPKGWKDKDHRTDLQFVNPENRSVITGEASGSGKAGVGGRATAMFLDEFSQIKEDRETLHRTADTTDCRLFNGTHVGLATAFYRLTLKQDIKHITMHWSQHPDKAAGLYHYDSHGAKVVPHDPKYHYPPDFVFQMEGKPTGGPFPGLRSPWYDKQCARRGSERDIAMDLDIDPKGSVSQYFDALSINELKAQVACPPFWTGEMSYDSETGKPGRLVPMESGKLQLWMFPSSKSEFPIARYAAGADISMGEGATPSCFSVVNADTGVKVLEYASATIKPDVFATYCVAMCRLLKDKDDNPALFCWEAAGPGQIFGKTVMDLGFRNVYYRTPEFEMFADASTKPGWYPSNDGKKAILYEYREALFSRQMQNRSAAALDETLVFKYDESGNVVHPKESKSKDDPSGAKQNHADRVIADALAWKMVLQLGAGVVEKPEEKPPPELSLAWRRAIQEHRDKKARAWI